MVVSAINVTTEGEKVTLRCPVSSSTSTLKYQPIVWWHNKDKLVMKNKIRRDFNKVLSFNNVTGDLTIRSAAVNVSGLYKCGYKFQKVKHFIMLVVGKCLSLSICLTFISCNMR